MEEFVDNFYKRNRGQIKKFFDYIKENDWSEPEESIKKRGDKHYTSIKNVVDNRVIVIKGRQPEYAIQNKLVDTVIERLEHFVSKVGSDITKPYVKKPLEMMTELINYHLDRIDGYLSLDIDMKSSESSTVEGEEYLNEEIDFDNILYKSHSKIYDKMSSIDLGTNKDRTEGIEFFGGDDKTAKAPLSMLNEIMREYPEVREKLDSMGIDFKSKPKNEMLIHIPEEEIPYWDEGKHFFNQSKEAIQFFLDEFKKAELGIEIDGVKISPWLYCHINLFKASIPQPHYNEFTGRLEPKDVIMNPPLRDNEYFMIQETYYEAEDEMVFFCATRRAAKTTNIASHIFHSLIIGKRNGSIVGGSSFDLGHIKTDIKLCLDNVHPAFRIHVINNWDDPIVRIGIKKKNQKDILKAEIKITNLSVGTGDANTKLAGFTPDFFVFDEIMKMDFEKPLAAAKASFDSVYGKRLTPILSGTGSINDDISEDTVRLLADPEKGGVKAMDWDALERNIPSDCITWKRRKFGTFIPGQMSVKVGMVKNEMPLWEYLKIEKTEKLDKIKILVTDWRVGKEIIERDRKNLAFNKDKLIQEKVDYPIDPEEIFLSGKTNPFMPETLRSYRNSLIESGDHGLNVTLDYDKDGNVIYEESDKKIAPFPYQGGFHDAPVTIYQPPVYNPPFEFYIAGLDDYKQEQSDGDSVGSVVIIRRDTKEVVASLHSRPDPHSHFHRQVYMLLQLYNCPVYMENADMEFKQYTDNLGWQVSDRYLLKNVNIIGDMEKESSGNRPIGWTPTPANKSYYLGLAINSIKTQDRHETEEGNIVTELGYKKIKDLRLLEEMATFRFGGNFDGITAYMSAVAYDYYLTYTMGAPEAPPTEEELRIREEERKRSIENSKRRRGGRSMFPETRGSMFPTSRGGLFPKN